MMGSKKQSRIARIAAAIKKHRRWFFLIIGVGLIILGLLFVNTGNFEGGSLSFLKPSAAEAAESKKLGERDARTFYDAGLLSHSAASNLFPQHKDSEPFKNLLKEAERNYLLAIEIWSGLYNEIPPDSADRKMQCERARLLESINYALWRLMPMRINQDMQNIQTAPDIKGGIVKNFIEAFAALEYCKPETKATTLLKSRMQKNLEKFREESKKQNERQQPSQYPSKSDSERSAMRFPDDKEASEVKKREDQINQEKKRAESVLRKEREKAEKEDGVPTSGEGEGEESTGKTRRNLESVPGIGQMPLPSIQH